MGVGAIFISTLAVHQLPTPSNPPQTQQDILTLSIQPIVSFVVLSSIIVRASAISNFFLTFNLHILLDGLSIPFFNLGQNVSRTVSLTATLSPRSRFQPDWVLNVNHAVPTLQEPASEVPGVAVDQVASAAASTDTPTIVPSQTPDIEPGPVVDERNHDMESLKRSISLD